MYTGTVEVVQVRSAVMKDVIQKERMDNICKGILKIRSECICTNQVNQCPQSLLVMIIAPTSINYSELIKIAKTDSHCQHKLMAHLNLTLLVTYFRSILKLVNIRDLDRRLWGLP